MIFVHDVFYVKIRRKDICMFKIKVFITLVIVIMCFVSTLFLHAEELETVVSAWVVANDCSSAGDEPTALAVGERTYVTVSAAIVAAASGDDKISIFKVTNGPLSKGNALLVRCVGITNNQVCTYNVHAGTLGKGADCALTLLGTLSFTIGTQVSEYSGYEYADTLTVTEGDSTSDWNSESPLNERIAEGMIDLQGADILVFVPTAAGCDCRILIKCY